MSKVCVPGGQVPLRTLVRVSDLRIFIIIDGFGRLEPPTRSCSARGEPGVCPWWASPLPDTSDEGLCPAENRSGALPVSAHGNILGTICRQRVRPRRSHVGTERQLRRAMKGKSPDDFVFTTAARSTSSASLRWTGGRRPTQCYKRGRLPTRPTTFVPESGYNRCRGRRDTRTTGRHRGTAMGSGHHCPG